IRTLIFEAGRVPVERSTTYKIRRVFDSEPMQPDPLDLVESEGARFGSYSQLISSGEFRFSAQRPARDQAPQSVPASPPRRAALCAESVETGTGPARPSPDSETRLSPPRQAPLCRESLRRKASRA